MSLLRKRAALRKVPTKPVAPSSPEKKAVSKPAPVKTPVIRPKAAKATKTSKSIPAVQVNPATGSSNIRLKQFVKPAIRPAVNHHSKLWGQCERCAIGQTGCITRHVLWRGYCPADVVFVGEAPGQSEDVLGKPFVGPSGKLLDRIIAESSLQVFGKPDAYTWAITNVVACMPTKPSGETRPPSKEEIQACSSRLYQFISLAQPRLIVMLGSVAEKHTPQTFRLTVLPPPNILSHPEWAVTEFDVSFVETINNIGTKKSVGSTSWNPNYLPIRHPAFMLRQKDPDLEVKRAVYKLSEAIAGSVVPF